MEQTGRTKPKRESIEARRRKRFWREVRPTAVLVVSALIVFLIARFGVKKFVSTFIDPVDKFDATPYEITIPSSSSASSIARILYNAGGYGEDDEGLITNTAVFKVYVDFVGKANSLKAGTYILSKNMSVGQIVDVLCEGNPPRSTVKITIPEGYTAGDIANLLVTNGLITDANEFLSACQSTEGFLAHNAVAALPGQLKAAGRTILLEGYLFPDTYELYTDAGVTEIIEKLLTRFDAVFDDAYRARAEALGMRVDEVMTLASLIEREAQAEGDFARVSAVFHNRLAQGMPLQSCASLSYVLGVKKYTFSAEEIAVESPYNTYLNKSLPIGPISNPGKAAIEAALYPNEEFVREGYLYFCNGEETELVFAKTYEEHEANVERYQEFWK